MGALLLFGSASALMHPGRQKTEQVTTMVRSEALMIHSGRRKTLGALRLDQGRQETFAGRIGTAKNAVLLRRDGEILQ